MYPVQIVNGYYDEPVYHAIEYVDYSDYRSGNGLFNNETFGYLFWTREAPTEMARYDLHDFTKPTVGYRKIDDAYFPIYVATVSRLDFYQDKKWECYLFSYTNEELRQLQVDAGYPLGSKDIVFVLMENGLQVMSNEDFNQKRQTFSPHPFNPALCRPKPEYLEK